MDRTSTNTLFSEKIFKALFCLFIISTLIDPADKLFGLKVYLFIACFLFAFVQYLLNANKIYFPLSMIIFTLSLILLPVMSMTHYFLLDGSFPYGGFVLFKAYLFIFLTFALYIIKIDSVRYLVGGLNLLLLLIFSVTLIILIFPDLFLPVYIFGAIYGIFSIDEGRDYGAAGDFFQMYFVTSPMLVFSVAYYFDKVMKCKIKFNMNCILLILSLIGLFLAGSRNNMLAAVILPFFLLFLYTDKKILLLSTGVFFLALFIFIFSDQLLGFLDPKEASNFTKLLTYNDYVLLFSENLYTLFFGEGLGASRGWTGRGNNFVTELTYFEIIRSYGLILGFFVMLIMFFPIVYAFFLKPTFPEKHLIIAYFVYLIMSFSNPLFFSSMGMLLLSVIMTLIYTHQKTNSQGV